MTLQCSRMVRLAAATLTLGAGLANSSIGADYFAASAESQEFYRVDSITGQTALVGQYSLVDPSEASIGVIARSVTGSLFGISNSQNISRVYSIDELSGGVTPLHSITVGPVFSSGAAIDPTDGSLYFTNTFGFVPWPQLHRLDLATGQTTVLGNIGPTIQDSIQGLAFTPDGNLYGINPNQKSVIKIDKANPTTGSTLVGTGGLGGQVNISQGATLFFDDVSQQLVGYQVATRSFFIIDLQSGLGNPVPIIMPVSPLMSDFAPSGCSSPTITYGQGCAGSGGFVPTMFTTGCPEVGSTFNLNIENGLGGAPAIVLIGLNQASIPVGFGCNLNITPILPASISVSLGGTGAGAGSLSILAGVPPTASGITVTLQTFVIDPSSPLGASATNGLQVAIL